MLFRSPILRFLTYPLVFYLRKWDLVAASRPDKFIAISDNVAGRIKKYYKRGSVVIYPPSDRLFQTKTAKKFVPQEKNYFLVVSRLVDYKRIDLAVRACTRLKLPLVVVGEGGEYEKLDALSGETVVFKGKVSDEELLSYYKNCRALIFPGEEDFGITMVEVQLSGKPVIAYGAGGALEIVRNGKTGIFFRYQTVDSLCSVLKKFSDNRYNGMDCKINAKRFSDRAFKKAIIKFLKVNKYL